MIEKLIGLVRQHAGDDIVRNQAIPDQHNDDAIREVGDHIYSGLQGHVQQGKTDQVAELFNNGGGHSSLMGNPLVSGIISSVAGSFGSKYGIQHGQAHNIASSLVPKVLQQFVHKTKDPGDRDFDLQDMIGKFGGGGGAGDLLSKISGGGRSHSSGGSGAGGILGKMLG